MITHSIQTINNQECITCKVCGFTSYNIGDIKHLYCAKCDMFHDYPEELKKQIINKNKEKL